MGRTGVMIKYIGSECSTFIEMDREKIIDMVSYFATNAQKFLEIQTEKDTWFINLDSIEYIRFIYGEEGEK